MPQPSADSGRATNNFGFLRVLFAILVVLSHSPELVDGNRSREGLTQIFGTLSFGELAVDGFFLISGYLIAKSFEQSRSPSEYLVKRILRIYPGYAVAYIISLLVVGGLTGGNISGMHWLDWVKQGVYMVFLNAPHLDGAFAGLHYPELNGSMWTIPYEFRCYLLLMLLGLLGILNHRLIYLAMTLAIFVVSFVHQSPQIDLLFDNIVPYYIFAGALRDNLHFFAIFLCGGAFYLFRDRISYSGARALTAAVILLPLMSFQALAEPALAILGGYLLFWFSFHVKSNALRRVGQETDLSYGLYLYGWPIQSLLIWYFRDISPWTVFGVATLTAAAAGYVSWTFIERPFLMLKSRVKWARKEGKAAVGS